MKTVFIKLSSVEDIGKLVEFASKCQDDVDLSCGSYSIDAKSIMGIFGLDLSKPVELTVHGNDEELISGISSLIVKSE